MRTEFVKRLKDVILKDYSDKDLITINLSFVNDGV